MRKYRYTDPKSSTAKRYAIGQFLKFFIGWNLVGYCVWTYVKSSARKKDPEFDKKSNNEKVLSLMGYKDERALKKYRLKIGSGGISLEKDETERNENKNQGSSENDSSNQQDSSNGSKTNR